MADTPSHPSTVAWITHSCLPTSPVPTEPRVIHVRPDPTRGPLSVQEIGVVLYLKTGSLSLKEDAFPGVPG